MGLDYSFRFVVPRDRADALLAAVADQALDEYAERLRKALPWAPQDPHKAEAGIDGLQSGPNDISNHYALVLLFPIDAEIEDYLTDPDGWQRDDQWELLPQAKDVSQPPEVEPDRLENVDEYCRQALELAGLA